MMGKSPLMKKLVGKQGSLPENLKAAIKAAPGKMVSPLKKDPPSLEDKEVKKTYSPAAGRVVKGLTNIGKQFARFNPIYNTAYEAEQTAINSTKNKDSNKKVEKVKKTGEETKVKKTGEEKKVKKVTPKKVEKVEVKKPVQGKSFLNTGSVSAGRGSIKMPSTSGSPAMPSFTSKASESGKKVINRGSSFTDEYGNTFERSVKGRKKADGSSYKTISNKRT